MQFIFFAQALFIVQKSSVQNFAADFSSQNLSITFLSVHTACASETPVFSMVFRLMHIIMHYYVYYS